MKVKVFTIIVSLILVVIAYGFFKSIRSAKSKPLDTLIVGTAAGYAPFVSINSQGEYEGFDIDIAKALALQMRKKLEIKDMGSMTSLFMALEQGTIDVIIWALSITKDRLNKVDMVHYQGENVNSYPLIFWKDIPKGINNLNDMKGMTICVEPTSSQSKVLSKYKNIIINPTDKVDDALLNVQYGKATAALVEPAIAKKFKNKYPEIKILEIPLTPDEQVYGIGIAVRKNNIDLLNKIKLGVQQLKQSGIIAKYEKKWDINE